jgi:F-type H+-transporting ATPase subunit b
MLTFPPDISFVIQIASFFVLWFGLKRLIFDPVVHVLEERESRTVGARNAAAEMTAAAGTSQAEYEHRIQDVRVALAAEGEAARTATQNAEREVITQARDEAGAQLQRLRESLARQMEAAQPTLLSEARDLSVRMVERVVERPVA